MYKNCDAIYLLKIDWIFFRNYQDMCDDCYTNNMLPYYFNYKSKKDLIKYFEYYDYKYVFLDFPFKDMITNYFQRKINKKIIFFLQKQKKKISHKYINKIVKYLKRKK